MQNRVSGNTHILQDIEQLYPRLPGGQQRIARYILEHPRDILNLSITDLAGYASMKSEASVVKFYKTLGFSGYKEFKIALSQEISNKTFYHSYDEDITFDDSPEEIRNKVFYTAVKTLTMNAGMEGTRIEEAIRLLTEAKRIIFIGYAASAAICYYGYFRFTELGYCCHFSPDSHINAAMLAHTVPGDLVFCVSHSGETSDIIRLLVKIPPDTAKILLLTEHRDSTIARLSDTVIETHSGDSVSAPLTDSMNARCTQLCMIDALFSVISISQGSDAVSRLQYTRQTFKSYKQSPADP